MRGGLAAAPVAHPIAALLPAVYADDDLAGRLCTALDQVLAPVALTLDSLPAYLDPDTVPEDLLDWLGSWVALPLAVGQGGEAQRRLVRAASELHALRGTLPGLLRALETALGPDVRVEVAEGGGVAWSVRPGAQLPGTGARELVVRVAGPGPADELLRRADAVVALVKPAHLPHRTELADG